MPASSPKRKRPAVACLVFMLGLAGGAEPAPPSAQTRPAPGGAAARPARRGEPVRPAVNPHWSETGCRHCHTSVPEQAVPAAEVEALCVKCHDGVQAPSEPHPVGRPFTRDTIAPAGWPSPGGKVTCISCHEIHPGGRPRQSRPAENPMFLRAYRGDLLAFCGECHAGYGAQGTVGSHGRYNPHLAMLAPDGAVIEPSCAFCHTQPMPAGEKATRTGQPHLRADNITMCLSCHSTHPDWYTPGHIGAQATPAVREALAALERRRSSRPPAGQHSPSTQPARQTLLPLGGTDGNTIVCGTCHNPHQKGVFPEGSALDAGGMRAGGQADALRGLGKGVCGACHAK